MRMKILIVEDDPTAREVLCRLLVPYGAVEIAGDGKVALRAVGRALDAKAPYDLICLDILMPVLDGQKALEGIREAERRHGITGLDGAKVIMTTALDDKNSIFKAFRQQCEAYLVKPVSKENLLGEMSKLGLIS